MQDPTPRIKSPRKTLRGNYEVNRLKSIVRFLQKEPSTREKLLRKITSTLPNESSKNLIFNAF